MKSVLTIAGSDPSGGAGIQQDLRVFAALNVAGLSAITAITVQNTQGVRSVHLVEPELLRAQIEAILEDVTNLGAVKIGMLGGAEQVRVVAEMLRRFRPPNVVLDPVLASSGGVPLLDAEGRDVLVKELFPLCDLITPNAVEAAELAGIPPFSDHTDLIKAGWRLLEQGPRAVLIKGGHMPVRKSIDFLFEPGAARPRELRRVEWPDLDLHGTGCFLSSAIAAYMPSGWPIWAAIHEAKGQLVRAMTFPVETGKGRGYPDIYVPLWRQTMSHEERLARLRGPYVITDSDLQPSRSHSEIGLAALEGGAKVIQLRDKGSDLSELIEIGRRLQFQTAIHFQALTIINDRVDVALAANADGVHLGPEDMPIWYARELLGPHKLIGVSVSSVEEILSRELWDASYFGVGAIFGSATKLDAGNAIGLEPIRQIKAAFPNKPIVAIGGINAGNIDSVIAAGADCAAVISAVVCAPDMVAATRELCGRFERVA